MRAEGWSPNGKSRAVLAAFTAAFLASCTTATGPGLEMAAPSYNSGVVSMMADVADSAATGTEGAAEATAAAGSSDQAAAQPDESSAKADPVQQPEAAAGDTAATEVAPAEADTKVANLDAAGAEPEAAAKPAGNEETATPAESADAIPAAETQQVAAAEEPRKKGFLSYFFSPQPAKAEAPSPIVAQPEAAPAEEKPAESEDAPAAAEAPAEPAKPLIDTKQKAEPLVKLASLDPDEATPRRAPTVAPMDALPGVRTDSLFEIKRKDGLDDDSDIDLNEAEGGIYHVASAAGLARLAPNGLLKARESVDTACLKPSLVRLLKQVEQRFGKKMIITSGYRSPAYNRKVRGARKSQHMNCAAADILMPGVSKWDIAQYVRAMPGRGGVGTYCHTDAVHIDVGPERDWNWRCRRRK